MTPQEKELSRKLEEARSTLQIILIWATFEYGELKPGHALDPKHVEELCRKTLKKIE